MADETKPPEKKADDEGAVEAALVKRIAKSPLAALLIASLIPSGVVGFTGNNVSGKLDALLTQVNDLKVAVSRLQEANLDSRVRDLERKVDRLELAAEGRNK